MATRKTARRATKARSTRTSRTARRAKPAGRTMDQILIELGRQALVEGVKEVLEDHGVDSSVKVDMVLRPPSRRGAAKARSAKRRR